MSSDPDERALARLLDNPAVWAEVTPGLKERVLAEALGRTPASVDEDDDLDHGEGLHEEGLTPPTDLRSRVLGEATSRTTGRSGDRPPAHRAASAPSRAPLWQRPVLLAAAAVALVGIAIGGTLVATRDPSPPTGTEVALAGTDAAPGATGTVDLVTEPSGFKVTINVSGLPPAPDGTFYEAWVLNDELGKVSAGTFHIREPQDDITLWLGVDPADYDAISVTRQPVDGGTLAEGVPVLKGALP